MQDHTPPTPLPNEATQPANPAYPDSERGSTSNQVRVGTRRGIRVVGLWYYVVTIATAGLFAWVPFLHAERKLKNSKTRWLLGIYAGLDALIYVLLAITPQDSQGNATGAAGSAISTVLGLLVLGIVVVGCIQQTPLRRMVYDGAPTREEQELLKIDPAVQAALAARARRDEARKLAAGDPLLARELHIGRPDMSRDYDDGGLIDLNSAPAAVIAEVCGIPAEVATAIVAARTDRGAPFANVDELFVVTDLPVSAWDRIRDRAVLLP